MIEVINFQNTQAYIKSCQTSAKVYSYTECENSRTKEFLLIQKQREWKMTVTAPKTPTRSPQLMHLVFPVREQRRTKVSANKEQKLLVAPGLSPGSHLLTRFFSMFGSSLSDPSIPSRGSTYGSGCHSSETSLMWLWLMKIPAQYQLMWCQ